MKVYKILRPQNIISIQYIVITILLIYYKNENTIQNLDKIIQYIYIPYLIYFIFVLFTHNLTKTKRFNEEIFRFKMSYKIIELIILLAIILNIFTIIEVIKLTGLNILSNDNILYFQRNPGIFMSISIAFMNIIPIAILIFYYRTKENKNKKDMIILIIYLLQAFFICTICGVRLLFFTNFIPLVVVSLYKKNINYKMLKRSVILFVLCIFIIIGGQSIKTKNSSIKDNIIAVTQYYTESIRNVFYIMNYEYGNLNKDYWSVYRTLKGVPYINFNKIDEWYINKNGYIPINNRDDDFEYVKKMGIQPKNNTFSVWGYSFLDYGNRGLILIVIQFLFIQCIYILSTRNKKYELIYIFLILFIIEQIRTNGIINSRVVNGIILFGILVIFDKILYLIKYKVNK